jgi:DNA-binding Xre family transcriptional regulator
MDRGRSFGREAPAPQAPGAGPVISALPKGADLLDVELGRRLRERRDAVHMTLADLGARVGLSAQQIHKYEHGANRISFSTLVRVCRVLDCPLSDLVAEVEHGARAVSPTDARFPADGLGPPPA